MEGMGQGVGLNVESIQMYFSWFYKNISKQYTPLVMAPLAPPPLPSFNHRLNKSHLPKRRDKKD